MEEQKKLPSLGVRVHARLPVVPGTGEGCYLYLYVDRREDGHLWWFDAEVRLPLMKVTAAGAPDEWEED